MENNYEQKYKKALDNARLMYDSGNNDVKHIVGQLFPELAESEDEKVRKEIIRFIRMEVEDEIVGNKWLAWLEKQGQVKESTISQHEIETCKENNNSLISEDEKVRKALLELVHDTTGDELWVDYNVHKEEALAWLERQGDYANFRNKAQVGDRITKNEDGVLVNLTQLKRVSKSSEKQCEQKFEMKTAEESLGIDSDTYNKIVDECIFGEKKHVLSEEDEELLKWSINNLIELKDRFGEEYGKVGKCIDWVKSLQDRVQPKQEWSEEDEEILRTILSDGIRGAELDMLQVNWLKSLRPQNRWKPSEEQMNNK